MILGRLYDLALWPHPWPWPWSFKVKSEIALSQEWGGRLTMNEKDVSHPFMTIILTCVTMVGWADVLDSDRGDFRRRCAVDISSLLLCCQIVLRFCTEHDGITAILCATFQNDLTTEIDLLDKRDFATHWRWSKMGTVRKIAGHPEYWFVPNFSAHLFYYTS